MVLESLVNPTKARKDPSYLFLLGFIYAVVGIIIAEWIFPSDKSIALVFLTTFSMVPFLVNLLKSEEAEYEQKMPFFKRHNDVILIFLLLFLGTLTAYTMWNLVYGSNAFERQVNTINSIRNDFSGSAVNSGDFWRIVLNNVKVIGFTLFFSFLFGSGAIFVIVWNASVIAVAIAGVIKEEAALLSPTLGSYIQAVNIGFGTYMTHGIFEILGYFLAAIAGGILSAAVIRKDIRQGEFKEVLKDSSMLIALSLITIAFAALIEVL